MWKETCDDNKTLNFRIMYNRSWCKTAYNRMPWLQSWFEDCDHIVIDTADLDLSTVSFTYGDSHPTFSDRVNDGKEYRKKLYTYDEDYMRL